jgi:hypothetical protein
MPPRKLKDDTKQCTLSFGGGVLSPSASTLHDSKQPRITHMLVGASTEELARQRGDPGGVGKAARGSKLQLSRRAHAKEDAPDGMDGQVSRMGPPAARASARVRALSNTHHHARASGGSREAAG